jgi:hypothetical protein
VDADSEIRKRLIFFLDDTVPSREDTTLPWPPEALQAEVIVLDATGARLEAETTRPSLSM